MCLTIRGDSFEMKGVWSYRTSVQTRPLHQHPPVLQMRQCFHLGVQFPWGKKFQHVLLHISPAISALLALAWWSGTGSAVSADVGQTVHVQSLQVPLWWTFVREAISSGQSWVGIRAEHMWPVAGWIMRAVDLLLNTLPVWDLGILLFFPSLSVWTTPASSHSPCSHVIVLAGGNAACCVIDGVPSVTLAASTHSNPPALFTLLLEAAFTLFLLPRLALPFRLVWFF